jgi:hypothetical protein
MPRERLLITVKTYPTLSRKYGETVCTAALREDGSWIRLYPIPFRLLEYTNRYQKFDWIETTLAKSSRDPRPETHHPVDVEDIAHLGHMDTSHNWRDRRKLVLGRCQVHTRLDPLIEAAHANKCSLALFKPAKILDFTWEPDDRDWDESKVQQMRNRADQCDLFAGEEDWRQTFQLIPKLPWKFSYRFQDADGRTSELSVLDWEAGQLYWNCLKQCNGLESLAKTKVRQKYFDAFLKTDLHFFLGTTQQYSEWSTNPWIIVGVFPIPHEHQQDLF